MEMRVVGDSSLSTRKLLLAGIAAALVAGTAAAPAYAEDWRGRHEWRDREGRHHREHEWREREWRDRRWRGEYPYYGYAPPVIAAPPPAYYAAPPVPGFNLVFPIR